MLSNPNQSIGILQKYFPTSIPKQYVARIKGVKTVITPRTTRVTRSGGCQRRTGARRRRSLEVRRVHDDPGGLPNLYTNEFIAPCKHKARTRRATARRFCRAVPRVRTRAHVRLSRDHDRRGERRNVATTLCATTADVRGFAEATFASRSEQLAEAAPRREQRHVGGRAPGPRPTRAFVASKPSRRGRPPRRRSSSADSARPPRRRCPRRARPARRRRRLASDRTMPAACAARPATSSEPGIGSGGQQVEPADRRRSARSASLPRPRGARRAAGEQRRVGERSGRAADEICSRGEHASGVRRTASWPAASTTTDARASARRSSRAAAPADREAAVRVWKPSTREPGTAPDGDAAGRPPARSSRRRSARGCDRARRAGIALQDQVRGHRE